MSEKSNKFTGIVKITAKPIGFVDLDPENPKGESVIIFEDDLNCALNRDTVEVEIIGLEPGRRGAPAKQKGRVVRVIERSKTEFVGSLQKTATGFALLPDDFKFYRPIDVTGENLQEGYKALATLVEWTNPKSNPRGEVTKIIGKKGVHETEMQSIILSKGILYNFPPEVEEEAKHVGEEARTHMEEEAKDRRDFRNIMTCTIDPLTAKDFDDALSYKEIDAETVEVGIHIADVSHFVRPGTVLDKEARKREFSTYLVDRTIPMLPEVLSADMCSLNPNVDRLAFSSVFEINKNTGAIKTRWFGKTIINSNRRFTYEEAQEVLDGTRDEYTHELGELDRLAKIYRAQNRANGAIEFETEEVKFELDPNGKPLRVYKKARIETMRMIEDWMLLANKEVAKFIGEQVGKRGGAGLYRVHDLPNAERLESLEIFLKALGFEFDLKNGVTGKTLNKMLAAIQGSPAEALIKTTTVRSMAKAAYSPQNIGHFGLAFEFYTHFTSPIRRYPDLVVHRIVQKHVKGEPVSKDEFAQYQKISEDASEKEIATAEAERESIKYKQVEYMQTKVGETFEGLISGVTEWGMYIEEPETKAEGMVRLKDIGDDFYSLDEKNYAIVGERTKRKFSLGDKIKVQLVAADIERKTLDFKVVK